MFFLGSIQYVFEFRQIPGNLKTLYQIYKILCVALAYRNVIERTFLKKKKDILLLNSTFILLV